MKFQNFIRKSLVIGVLVVSFFSCSGKTEKIKLVYPNKVNYESFIIAKHLNYFSSDIEVQTVSSGINAAEAFVLGDAQLAAMGDGPTVMLMAQNKDFVIVTRYAQGNKIHRLIADSTLKSASDLKSKKLGVQMSSSSHGALLSWLKANGLDAKDVELVPMDPQNMPEAMKTKQLDAIAGSEPWALNVEKMCGSTVHELSNLENVNNCFPHTLVSNPKVAVSNSKQIIDVVHALKKANDFIKQHPDSAAEIAAKYIKISIEEEKICISRLTWECGWTEKDQSSLNETAHFFLMSGKIKKMPTIGNYLKIEE